MSAAATDALNRVILCHFDTYSTALVFARWDNRSLLWPAPLPEGSTPCEAPANVPALNDPAPLLPAMVERLGVLPDELVAMPDFDAWLSTPEGPVRVHLMRFETFEAPAPVIGALGGVFKPISELRGSAMVELNLLRQVFNLIIGGGR